MIADCDRVLALGIDRMAFGGNHDAMKVYLNGKFVDASQAQVPVFDAGLQHGVGIFDTMRAYNHVVFRLEDHVDRLINSARELGLANALRSAPLCEAIQMAVKENDKADARVRITMTGGSLAMLGPSDGEKPPAQEPTIFVVVTDPTVYPESFIQEGASVVLADPKVNPLDPMAGHKTINYWSRLQSLRQAAGVGAAEALWFSVTNHLASGAVSNVFLVKDDTLLTPIAHGEEEEGALMSPVLPGITRKAVLEAAQSVGMPIEKKMLDIEDVLGADEVFLTNSSWLVLPVTQVEQKEIAGGKVGRYTVAMYENLLGLIETECY